VTRNFQLWADRTANDLIFDEKAFGELDVPLCDGVALSETQAT
jgi:hypothetical protein